MYTVQKRKPGLDIGDPKLLKFGKEIDVRTWINKNNVDCEIYETLEKYGKIKKNAVDMPQIIGEFEQLDLRKHLDREIATGQMWEGLPLEVRQEFRHDKNLFAETGEQWMRDKEAAKVKAPAPAPAPAPEPTPEGETTNGE